MRRILSIRKRRKKDVKGEEEGRGLEVETDMIIEVVDMAADQDPDQYLRKFEK